MAQQSSESFLLVYIPPLDWAAPSREVHTIFLPTITVEPFQGTHCHSQWF
jgi:hypothetical protein